MAKPSRLARAIHSEVIRKAIGFNRSGKGKRTAWPAPRCPDCESRIQNDQWNPFTPKKSVGSVIRCVACDSLLELKADYVKAAGQPAVFVGLSAASLSNP